MKLGILRTLAIPGFIALSAFAADVSDFSIAKGRHYEQWSQTRIEIRIENAYRFNVIVDNVAPGSVSSVRVTTPNGGGINAFPDADGSPWRVRERFDYPFDLDNNYPNGTFTLSIVGAADGQRDLGFNISGDLYPNPPVLNDYESAQGVRETLYNEFSWQPFEGGSATDFIQFAVEDLNGNTVFETPDFGEEGALTGLARSCIVPPGKIRAGGVYQGTIRFVKVLFSGHRGYPGVPGYAGYFSRTEFPVRGVAGPARSSIETLQIWKSHRLEYSDAGVLGEANDPWHFVIRAQAPADNMLLGGTVTMPSPAGTRTLTNDVAGREVEYVFDQSTSATALNTAFPNGVYTVRLDRADQTSETKSFNYLTGNFPPAPSIQNLAAIRSHDANNDLVVTWTQWAGASESDFIRVELEDEFGADIYDTPGYAKEDHLRSTATSVVIPALAETRLVPGRTYALNVTFYRVTTLDIVTAPGGMIFGGFATRSKVIFTARPPDVRVAGVRMGRRVWERSRTLFEPDPAAPFEFSANLWAQAADLVSNVSMRTPRGESVSLNLTGSTNFIFRTTETSLEPLTMRFPLGDYTFNAQTTGDGSRSLAVNLAALDLPPQPAIPNLNVLQATSRSVENRVYWTPWANADTNTDNIVVTVENALGLPLSISTTLSATNQYFSIAPNVLSPNSTYTVRVRFERLARSFSEEYPGVQERAALFSETVFYMSTIALANFRISSATQANNAIQFNVAAPVGPRLYRIDWTADFREWFPGGTYTSSTMTNFPIQMDVPGRFFRLILVP